MASLTVRLRCRFAYRTGVSAPAERVYQAAHVNSAEHQWVCMLGSLSVPGARDGSGDPVGATNTTARLLCEGCPCSRTAAAFAEPAECPPSLKMPSVLFVQPPVDWEAGAEACGLGLKGVRFKLSILGESLGYQRGLVFAEDYRGPVGLGEDMGFAVHWRWWPRIVLGAPSGGFGLARVRGTMRSTSDLLLWAMTGIVAYGCETVDETGGSRERWWGTGVAELITPVRGWYLQSPWRLA